jgi:hypothetical protein
MVGMVGTVGGFSCAFSDRTTGFQALPRCVPMM